MLSKEEKKILEQAQEILKREEENVYEDAGSVYSNPTAVRQDRAADHRASQYAAPQENASQYSANSGYAAPGREQKSPVHEQTPGRTNTPEADPGNGPLHYRGLKEYDEEVTEFREVGRRKNQKSRKEKDSTKEPPTGPAQGEKKKKKRHPLRVIFILLLVLALLFAGLFAAVYVFVGRTHYEPFEAIQEEALYNLPEKNLKGVRNILLIGTDARDPGIESRSDTIIVVSICPKQRRIYLTSILRDSYVDIPGYGQNRINHAYQMGGARLLVQTIEQNFGIRIDQYAKVDFYSFVDIIDSIGGVDIDVTDEEVHYVNAYLSEINQLMGIEPQDSFLQTGGRYTLNGRQALAFSRIRYIGTDFQRTARQRMVLEAAVDRLKHSSPKTVMHGASSVLELITTDISDLSMTALVFSSVFLRNYDLESARIPYDGLWWNALTENGQEVLGIDFDSTKAQFRSIIYGGQ